MRLKGCRRSVLQKSYDLTTSLRNVTGLDRPKDQQRVSQCQFTTFSHGQMETNARLTSSTDSGARIMSLRSLDVWPAGESFSQASAGCKGQKRPDEGKVGEMRRRNALIRPGRLPARWRSSSLSSSRSSMAGKDTRHDSQTLVH